MSKKIDPQHTQTRDTLRIVGPAIIMIGVIFSAIGIGSFFSSFGSFEQPQYFWCVFVGSPLLALGFAICRFAFMGAVSRYVANEEAPVGVDVVNYMAEGTRGAVREMAATVGEALRAGAFTREVRGLPCHMCNTDNEALANFCKGCGASLRKEKSCVSCGELNGPDARYCDHCGRAVA